MNNYILKARFITLGLAVAFLPFSIRFCHLFLLLFMITCVLEGNFAQRWAVVKQNPLAWLLPAFFSLHVISVIYSLDTSNAWANVDKKIAFFLAPLLIVSATPFTKEEIKRLMWIFLGACLAGTLVCIYKALIVEKGDGWNLGPVQPYLDLHSDASKLWPYFSYIHLSSGIGMHPTYFSLYLLIGVLIVLKTIESRMLSITLVGYLLVFIVFLSSRIVVISTLLILVFAAPRKKLLFGGIAIMIAAIVFNPVALYRNAQEYTGSNFELPPAPLSDNPISIRTSLWWLGAQAVHDVNPLVGTGVGDVEDTIASLGAKHNVHNVLNTSDPHNQYLHTYIALGAAGLLMLLTVFLVPLVILYRQGEFLTCAGLVALMAVCMTESALELQKGIVLFSLFIGLVGNQVREWKFSMALTDRRDKKLRSARSV